jgi:hypothetical protein
MEDAHLYVIFYKWIDQPEGIIWGTAEGSDQSTIDSGFTGLPCTEQYCSCV